MTGKQRREEDSSFCGRKMGGTVVWKHLERAELSENERNNEFASNVTCSGSISKGENVVPGDIRNLRRLSK